MADYDALSIEELDAELTRLWAEQKAILGQKKAVARALDKKLVVKSALEKAAKLSDAELAVLEQILRAESIESGEAVGAPGA